MLTKLAQYALPVLKRELPLSNEAHAAARETVMDDAATATGTFRSLEILLSQQVRAWEPETIWLELDDLGLDVPTINRMKILAVQTLLQFPSFFWDATVFENTALAFNNEYVLPEVLQEASPAQLSWAVYEVSLLVHSEGHKPDFDYEPTKYAAVSAHRTGLVLMPALLDFGQEELEKLTRGHRDNRKRVEERWQAIDKNKLDTLELKETPEDVQLGLLTAIHMHVVERADRYRQDLSLLSSAS